MIDHVPAPSGKSPAYLLPTSAANSKDCCRLSNADYKTLEAIAPLSDNAVISVPAIAGSPARPMPVAAE
jgi:hypothetical protein